MKFNSTLDLTGNQLINFLVHNGNKDSIGAQSGSFLYNTTDSSFYGGISIPTANGGSNIKWTRLVDVDHIGELSGFVRDGEAVTDIKLNGNNLLLFRGSNTVASGSVNIPVASNSDSGFMSAVQSQHLETAYEFAKTDFPKLYFGIYDTSGAGSISLTPSEGYSSGFTTMKQIDDIVRAFLHFDEFHLTHKIVYKGSDYGYIQSTTNSALAWPLNGTIIRKNNNLYLRENFEWVPINVKNANTAYSWGNHKTAGYAKISDGYAKIYKASPFVDWGVDKNTTNSQGESGWGKYLYFSTATFNLYIAANNIEDAKPNDGKDYTFYENWSASADSLNGLSSSDYRQKGVCIIVGNDIYKYNGTSWVLIYSGSSAELGADIENRLAAVEALLGDVNSNDTLDNWNELKRFLDGLYSDKENANLASLLSNYATSEELGNAVGTRMEKAQNTGNEYDVLSLMRNNDGSGSIVPTWKKTKICETSKDEYLKSKIENGEWTIDISSLGTNLVCVTIYRTIPGTSNLEMVITDVRIESNKVIVGFNNDNATDETYMAVITA